MQSKTHFNNKPSPHPLPTEIMRIEILFFAGVAFVAANMYYDGKLTNWVYGYKKHYKIAAFVLGAFVFYWMIKRDPVRAKNILFCLNNYAQVVPLRRGTFDQFSPLFDLTQNSQPTHGFLNSAYSRNGATMVGGAAAIQTPPVHGDGVRPVKRAVSETKKKYVASNQNWKCGHCNRQLTHTFEIDHRVRLDQGGSNEVQNLIALCRECHGQKTAAENM